MLAAIAFLGDTWLVAVVGVDLADVASGTAGVAAVAGLWKLLGSVLTKTERDGVEKAFHRAARGALQWGVLGATAALLVAASLGLARVRVDAARLGEGSVVELRAPDAEDGRERTVGAAKEAIDFRLPTWPWGRALVVRVEGCGDETLRAVPWRVRRVRPCGSPGILFRVPAALLALLAEARIEVAIDGAAAVPVALDEESGAVLVGGLPALPSSARAAWELELAEQDLGEVDRARAVRRWEQPARLAVPLERGSRVVARFVADGVPRAGAEVEVGDGTFTDQVLAPLPAAAAVDPGSPP